MNKLARYTVLIALFSCITFTPCVFAHSGGTDRYGGHHDYDNVSGLGLYHYHHGYGPHLHKNGNCPIVGELMPMSPDDPDSAERHVAGEDESEELKKWREYRQRGYNLTSVHPILNAQIGARQTIYDWEYPWWDVSCWELWKQILALSASLYLIRFGLVVRHGAVKSDGRGWLLAGAAGTIGFGIFVIWNITLLAR